MYDALTDDQKALVDTDTKAKLDAASAKIRELEALSAADDAADKTDDAKKDADEVKDGDTEGDLDKANNALKDAQDAIEKLKKAKEKAEKALNDAIAKYGKDSPEAKAAQDALDKINEQINTTTFVIAYISDIVKTIEERLDGDKPISISDAKVVLSATKYTYNGKVKRPVINTIGGMTLIEGVDYTIRTESSKGSVVTSPKAAGTYTINVTGIGKYTGLTKVSYTISKAANPLKIKGKKVKIKYKKIRKKTQTVKAAKAIKFTKKGKGKMTYKRAKISCKKKLLKAAKKKIKINKKTGKVTLKKGLKKGTYKVKIKVKAAGNANYKASKWKTVTVRITVK